LLGYPSTRRNWGNIQSTTFEAPPLGSLTVTLLLIWPNAALRLTRDIDLLSFGDLLTP
jgi:hypothetical protein